MASSTMSAGNTVYLKYGSIIGNDMKGSRIELPIPL